MKERWLPVGVLAGALFAVNVVARLVARFGFDGDIKAQDRISLGMLAVIGVVLAVLVFRWGRRWSADEWGGRIGAAVLVALVLTIFVGPFISGHHPFANGAGEFFAQIWLYVGFAGGGVLVGFLVLTALGMDYRSQQLRRFAETKLAKPRRVVRR